MGISKLYNRLHIWTTDLNYIDSASASNAENIRRICYPGKTNILRTAYVVISTANFNVKTNSKNYENDFEW